MFDSRREKNIPKSFWFEKSVLFGLWKSSEVKNIYDFKLKKKFQNNFDLCVKCVPKNNWDLQCKGFN